MIFEELNELIVNGWAEPKGLIKRENAFRQLAKLQEESGELASGMLKDQEYLIIDSIGDIYVVLSILCAQLGLDPVECLEIAYNEIKNRKGKTVNGTFIKE